MLGHKAWPSCHVSDPEASLLAPETYQKQFSAFSLFGAGKGESPVQSGVSQELLNPTPKDQVSTLANLLEPHLFLESDGNMVRCACQGLAASLSPAPLASFQNHLRKTMVPGLN